MGITKSDRLFALKALEKRVKREREEAEAECRDALIGQFEDGGSDRMRSPYFGNEAGTFTYIPPKSEDVCEWRLCDWEGMAEWLDENRSAAEQFVFANFEQFAKWWSERTGEVPGGVSRAKVTRLKPGSTRLAVKEDVVLAKAGGMEGMNALLLGREPRMLEGGEDA